MPAIGTITINDGASTPVAHNFTPVNIVGDVAKYADKAGGISVGYPVITVSSLAPTKTSRLYKARFKVVIPILEQLVGAPVSGFTPAPTKAYDMTADITFLMPERSTQQNRKDLLAFVKNLLANAVTTSVVQDNDVIY